MRLSTLSLARLMAAIAVLAVGLAALRYATPLWAILLTGIVLGLLLAVPAGIIYRRGPAQAGWLGFGIFAGAFALASLPPWTSESRAKLPNAKLVTVLHGIWHPRFDMDDYMTLLNEWKVQRQRKEPVPQVPHRKGGGSAAVDARDKAAQGAFEPLREWWSSLTEIGSREAMQSVGRSLTTLIVGLVGMTTFRWFFTTASRDGVGTTGV